MTSLRGRLSLLAALILLMSLALSVLLAYQLLRVVGQRDLDQSLSREMDRFTLALSEYTADLTADGQPTTLDVVRRAVNDYYRLNPGSDTYLTVVRLGSTVVVSPSPPDELAGLSERLAIPPNTVDGYQNLDSDAGMLRSVRAPISLGGARIGSVQVAGRLQPISEQTSQALLGLVAVAGISLVVGGSGLAVALVRGLAPLRDLAATAQRTGRLEDLTERVPESRRPDEIGVLSREFNRMLGRLDDSARERITFLASVSHELRTPVTIARGHVETLERGGADDAQHVRATASVIREELDRVARLVDDLLALARAQLSDFVVLDDVNLVDFFADLELRLGALGLHDVEITVPPEITLRGDATRLGQAMLNLARNASIHTPPGTRIVISARVTDAEVMVDVVDDGPGIDPAIADRVLEPFVRGTGHGEHDSSGLGLAVVDEVAQAHGGSVRIDTGSAGTTVEMRLPRTREAVTSTAVTPDSGCPGTTA